ncbi:glycoside hydrolase family 65 protein [Ruminiclostridium cellobioparum]|uniref:glycoside hydrolase family 65 protein n=1 Tax=Ruminiclostridium cellobioparum TaxID=29355 RepID=UPI0004849C53|nr:glycosyl hydrolase family 65 protein [Ruminiclostridium cellobioparum]
MGKFADRYFKVCPWEVIEEGFDPEYGRVSESIFSLGNEYMGVRGYFEEGYSGDKLQGSYLNGIYEENITEKSAYKGISNRGTFMVNGVDWLYTRLELDGEELDLAKSRISSFKRRLDMKTGVLTREFLWHTKNGKELRVKFSRFLSMITPRLGCQRITLEPVNFSEKIAVKAGLDFSPIHETMQRSLWDCLKQGISDGVTGSLGRTKSSRQMVYAGFKIQSKQPLDYTYVEKDKLNYLGFDMALDKGKETCFDRTAVVHAEKNTVKNPENVWSEGSELAKLYGAKKYDEVLAENRAYWNDIWNTFDVSIEGDDDNQQGIRYCIFQMHQTYHGEDSGMNIGAKGLTGEAYGGNAFWDTETYCLPFYLFNNTKAARNLLEYRYNTLPQAIERAGDLDCDGACYPIATLDGTESCTLWQHASLQFQPSTAVAYGIRHYVKITGDKAFLYEKGLEMLVQICRFLATRGQWSSRTGKFGYYGVMGPDEFQMMVNNNCYTNFMAKKTFEYTIGVLSETKAVKPEAYTQIQKKLGLDEAELDNWSRMAENMRIPLEEATGIYEQHEGYFDLPHIDIKAIPVTDFPLYHNWSYDRIYRNDMIKQPDVLMFMFLYNQDFSCQSKKVNYEFYEPRCIHESSLSPSVHSVLASELGRHREAFDFFSFATRMDLDNYNRNTREGLHTTSIAAAWVNIVYGFGGMRSDGEMLLFNPSIPAAWKSYSFRVLYRNAILEVKVMKDMVIFKTINSLETKIKIYGKDYSIGGEALEITVPEEWRG